MTDRIAEIREALAELGIHAPRPITNPERGEWDRLRIIERNAARELLALLASDTLIIRRDETSQWPVPILAEIDRLVREGANPKEFLDALASSQGVKP